MPRDMSRGSMLRVSVRVALDWAILEAQGSRARTLQKAAEQRNHSTV
jgi:hypothetical protein